MMNQLGETIVRGGEWYVIDREVPDDWPRLPIGLESSRVYRHVADYPRKVRVGARGDLETTRWTGAA
jgi:hypothetical protein